MHGRRRKRFRVWEHLCVLEANGGNCVYCGNPAEVMDHVIPWSQGGADELTNLVPACKACNNSKCDKTPIMWYLGRLMTDNWDGSGTVHSGVSWNSSWGLRELYMNRHEEALGWLDKIEEVLAEIADERRRLWFRESTISSYPAGTQEVF
ncbi:HNH endonuclease [Streptomyces sp. NBC_01571]|uniref:HNH endonuclease n=1 Tax=Streptomyces sp. NBC_01571 TaxID=2975883 RepID=UPI00225A5FD6|nr:HNH endonuclease signature motif containing protein [Streptomyces sp. NBC_01571]MCX4580793.1 HNH endonuclease [Streptomyces sp. NBC_01571]